MDEQMTSKINKGQIGMIELQIDQCVKKDEDAKVQNLVNTRIDNFNKQYKEDHKEFRNMV